MVALGLPTLAASLRNASSQNPNTQTHKNGPDERSDSSEYLPRAEEGPEDDDECVNTSVEKVSSQSWLGVFASRYPIYILILIFIQVLITDFRLCVRKLTTTTTSGVD